MTPEETSAEQKPSTPDFFDNLKEVMREAAKPRLGNRVHYVLADGQHRAATVVNVFNGSTRANLTVHLDGLNDLQPAYYRTAEGVMTANPTPGYCKKELAPIGGYGFIPGVLSVGSAAYDQADFAPGTWHHQEVSE